MAKDLDKVKHTVDRIKEVDYRLDYLANFEVSVRVGHSNNTYVVTSMIDAGLMELVKKHIEINLQMKKAALEKELAALAGGANG